MGLNPLAAERRSPSSASNSSPPRRPLGERQSNGRVVFAQGGRRTRNRREQGAGDGAASRQVRRRRAFRLSKLVLGLSSVGAKVAGVYAADNKLLAKAILSAVKTERALQLAAHGVYYDVSHYVGSDRQCVAKRTYGGHTGRFRCRHAAEPLHRERITVGAEQRFQCRYAKFAGAGWLRAADVFAGDSAKSRAPDISIGGVQIGR